MENFNFLTKINAVYNSANMSASDGFNLFYVLEVFINDSGDMLIKFNKCCVPVDESPSVEEGEKIFEGLKNNTYLRILNLYKNDLTNECIPKFCEMLLVNRKLEEINFGGNLLGDQALELIKTSTGKFLMTAEEVENYNKLAKEKQDIINKNIKAKAAKKPEMEIPYLDEMEIIEGVNYIVKNATLRVLNLIQNNLTEKSFEYLTAILDSNQDLVLTVDLKSFTEKQHEILTDSCGKYFNRIYLSK